MLQIRQSVFETNSSSSHSIVVQKYGSVKPTGTSSDFAEFEDGILTLHQGNGFHWGWDVLTNWLDRFAYTMAEFGEDENTAQDILERVKRRIDADDVEIHLHDPWWANGEEVPDFGSIDHQSQGTLMHFLSEKGIDELDFIFDDRYIVIIDNDNNYGDRRAEFISKLDVEDEYGY